jgi:outer membrane receptor for ferrienterochelin and colicins
MKKNVFFLILLSMILFNPGYVHINVYGGDENIPGNRHQQKIVLKGFILDEDGNPIPDCDVIILEKNIAVKTSKTGRFVVELSSGGKVHIEVYKSGFLPVSTKLFEIGGDMNLKPLKIILPGSPLEEVVVTGTLTPKLYCETPVKTAIASKKEIEQKGAVCLADSLEIMTGVRVENNCQNCNYSQVRINGMEGKYAQVLINGMPVVSALAGVYALEQIPANMIERLEVVKGGGSALYGGNAVAGVVNVITGDSQKSGTQISLSQQSVNKSPYTVLAFNTTYTSKNYSTHASFFTNYQDRQHMDYNDDGFSDLGELKNLGLGANFSHYFNALNGKLKLSFASIFEDRRGGNKFDLPEHFADIAESIRTYRTDFGLGWEQTFGEESLLRFDGSFSYTRRKSYYGAEQDPNAYGQTRNPLFYGTLVYNSVSLEHHNILMGVSYTSDHIEDLAPAYGRTIDDTYTDLGFFLQDEIEMFNDTTTLLVGIRGDRHSEIDRFIFSPRASLLYKGVKNLTFRGTFSTGFRAPQVFDEDLHITQVGGEGTLILNRDGLTEEKSYSFTLGIDYGKHVLNKLYQFSISGFYHFLDDVFTLEETAPMPNARVFERFNSEGAKVYGIEVEAGFKWADKFEIFTGWTFQKSQLEEPEPNFAAKELFRSPNVYGSVRIHGNIPKFVDIRTELNYTGSMKVPHFAGYIEEDVLEKTSPFAVLNLTVSKKISFINGSSVTLSASVYNLLDQFQEDLDRGIYRDAGYIYGPRFPRTFRLGLKYNF